MLGNYRVAIQLMVSREVLSSMELVNLQFVFTSETCVPEPKTIENHREAVDREPQLQLHYTAPKSG
jgi:hypothetical protein